MVTVQERRCLNTDSKIREFHVVFSVLNCKGIKFTERVLLALLPPLPKKENLFDP
jgi:hypothetical protein